jgi:hypothetical protein
MWAATGALSSGAAHLVDHEDTGAAAASWIAAAKTGSARSIISSLAVSEIRK